MALKARIRTSNGATGVNVHGDPLEESRSGDPDLAILKLVCLARSMPGAPTFIQIGVFTDEFAKRCRTEINSIGNTNAK